MPELASAGSRGGAGRLIAWAAVALLAGACVVGTVMVVADRDDRADLNSGLDWADREVAWGNGWMLSQDALYAARSLIPDGADYTVEKGPASAFDDPLTYRFAEGYLRYWLMPGKQVGGARWVMCMRCEPDTFGEGARVLWEDAGVAIVDRAGTA